MVEHWPILTPDVHNDLAKFVPDEEGQQSMLRQQQLWQAATELRFILTGYTNPHFVDQVLKQKQYLC